MRFALLLITCLTLFVGAGCGGNQPPLPTAEEAAKQPTPPPPQGADSARTASDR